MDPTLVQTSVTGAWQYGVLGIVALVFGAAIFTLWKAANQERRELLAALEASREARIADAQAAQAQMLELVRQVAEALAHGTNAMEANRAGMTELADFLREFVEELKRVIYEHPRVPFPPTTQNPPTRGAQQRRGGGG